MANKHLATFLFVLLVGLVVALDLMEHLGAGHAGTAAQPTIAELRAEVSADRDQHLAIMERLEIAKSPTRQAAGWLAEKSSRLKLLLDDPSGGALRLLEGLEALALALEGKRSLWRSLGAIAASTPALEGFDLPRLQQRADEHRERAEALRIEAAKNALAE